MNAVVMALMLLLWAGPAARDVRAAPPAALDAAEPGGALDWLEYAGLIQDRIQRAAGQRGWLTGDRRGGLVVVAFEVEASGRMSQPAVVPERSAGSPELQEMALRIVKAAAPFPPFPPALAGSRKSVSVPLEFLVDGGEEPFAGR